MIQDNRIDFNQLAKPVNLQNSAVLRFLEEEEERKRLEKAGLKRVAWPPPPEDQNYADFIEQNPVQVKTRGVGEYTTYESKSSSYGGEEKSAQHPQAQPVHQPPTPQPVYQPVYQPAYEPLYESPYETPYEPSAHTHTKVPVAAPRQLSYLQEKEEESESMPRTPWVSVGPSLSAQPQSQYQGLSPLKSGPVPAPAQAPGQQRPGSWGPQPQAAPMNPAQQQQPAWNAQSQAPAPAHPPQQQQPAWSPQPQSAAPMYAAQPVAWGGQPQGQVQSFPPQQQPAAWGAQPQGPVQGYLPQQQQPAWGNQPPPDAQAYLPQQYLPVWNSQPQQAVQPAPQPNRPQQCQPNWSAQSQPQPQSQPQSQANLPAWSAQPQVQSYQAPAPVQAPAPASSPSPAMNTCQQQYHGSPTPSAHQDRVQSPQPNYQQSPNTSNFEPPPSVITLRPEVPISQVPNPVYQGQPAATNPTSGSMRGDLKWPPPLVKQQMYEEEQARLELEKGPACRPPRNTKDYTSFFAQYASTNNYPGYRVPPGTQYFTPAYHR